MAGVSTYTQEIADEICDRIASAESLKAIVKDDHMPSESTVFKWLRDIEAFSKQYARAHDAQADTNADMVANIAERVINKEIEPNAGRVAIDAYKWAAGKRNPKKYGDKIDLNHSGSLQTQTNEQLDDRITQLLGKAGISNVTGRTGEAEAAEQAV